MCRIATELPQGLQTEIFKYIYIHIYIYIYIWACDITAAPEGFKMSLRRMGAEAWCGLGWVWLGRAGLLEYGTDPNPNPRPNKSTKQKMRGLLWKFLCFRGGLQKFMCLGPVPPEVPPFDLETITIATGGLAGVTKGGHQHYVGWGRWAPGTKIASANHILGTQFKYS